MLWKQVCENPHLQNLPFKIETNKWGKLVMSPARNKHGVFQGEIYYFLRKLASSGKSSIECAIQTKEGVKVPDVVWYSDEIAEKNEEAYALEECPEICIEVLSPGNSFEEMEEKKEIYFDLGAKECWICEVNGTMRFYSKKGIMKNSVLFPEFPSLIKY